MTTKTLIMKNSSKLKTAKPTKRVSSSKQEGFVSTRCLALQDEYYAKRRLPPATRQSAAGRTFCFRVEFLHDVYPLRALIEWAVEDWWSSPVCPLGDADVKVTLKPKTLNRNELRWLFARVGDCHVAMETVELERDYTGERKYCSEDELKVKVPSAEALKASLQGLSDLQETHRCAEALALAAENEVEAALAAVVKQQARSAKSHRQQPAPALARQASADDLGRATTHR